MAPNTTKEPVDNSTSTHQTAASTSTPTSGGLVGSNPSVDNSTKELTADEKIAALTATVTRLTNLVEATADKGRLDQFERKEAAPKKRLLNVSEYNGKIVTSWSNLTKNKVYKEDNKWKENQSTVLTFIDGTTLEVDYPTWQRDKVLIQFSVEKEQMLANGDRVFTVSHPDYPEFDINVKFVN